jgi:hypothetical protein
MPTNRRQRCYRRDTDEPQLTRGRLEHLLVGCAGGSGLLTSCTHYATAERFAADWRLLRDVVLPWWGERYPGSRPFAFWLLEAKYPQAADVPADHAIGYAPPAGQDSGKLPHRIHAARFIYPIGAAAFAWLRERGRLGRHEQYRPSVATVDLDSLLSTLATNLEGE